jgi:hypothetical protein
MRKIYQLLTLLPAPLFFIGFLFSITAMLTAGHSPCHHGHHDHEFMLHQWEMPAMWLIMFAAHITPWMLWYQQHFARNT